MILEYWINRNKSKTYSEKLLNLFINATILIQEYPQIGKPTTDKRVRFKVIKQYMMFYEEHKDSIIILRIWDSRQNPQKLKLK